MRRALLLALAVAVTACGSVSPPADRLSRALAAMERLEGMRFDLQASVNATGRSAPGGPIASDVRMTGEYARPDRLHVAITIDGQRSDLVLIERRTYVNTGTGYHQSVVVPEGALRGVRAPLDFVKGSGTPSFAGLGFARGAVTYRVRLDLGAGDLAGRVIGGDSVPPDARGMLEVEIGLFDDLVRRQRVEISSSADGGGSGLDALRTTYTVEYWDLGAKQRIDEPR